jgi:hypothetical protein
MPTGLPVTPEVEVKLASAPDVNPQALYDAIERDQRDARIAAVSVEADDEADRTLAPENSPDPENPTVLPYGAIRAAELAGASAQTAADRRTEAEAARDASVAAKDASETARDESVAARDRAEAAADQVLEALMVQGSEAGGVSNCENYTLVRATSPDLVANPAAGTVTCQRDGVVAVTASVASASVVTGVAFLIVNAGAREIELNNLPSGPDGYASLGIGLTVSAGDVLHLATESGEGTDATLWARYLHVTD